MRIFPQQNQFLVHEASPTSAANLEWFTKQWVNLDYNEINNMIEELPKADSSILFVPFLWFKCRSSIHSGFYGIQSIHSQAHYYKLFMRASYLV